MDQFRKNLYTIENLRVVNHELDNIDDSLERKLKINKEYTDFLNHLLEDTLNHYEKVVKNLDGGKKTEA